MKKIKRNWLIHARNSEKIPLLALAEITIELEEAVALENDYKREVEREMAEKLKKLVLLELNKVKDDIFSEGGKRYKVDFTVNDGKVLLNLEKMEK